MSCFAKEKKIDQPLGDGEVDMAPTLRSGEFDGMCDFILCLRKSKIDVRTLCSVDWVGLKQDGQSRGEVYLECTYYSAVRLIMKVIYFIRYLSRLRDHL